MNAHRRRDYRGRLISPLGVGMFPARSTAAAGSLQIDTITFDGANYEVNGVDGGTGNVCKIDKASGVATFLATPDGDVTVTAVGHGGNGAADGTGGGGGAFCQSLMASVVSGDTMTVTMNNYTADLSYLNFLYDKTSTAVVIFGNGADGDSGADAGKGGLAHTGTTKHSGGNGGTGNSTDGGGGGGSTGGSGANGNNGANGAGGTGGAGGAAPTDGYAGGKGGNALDAGGAAPSYGGGGGGAGNDAEGGEGGAGVIFIAATV